MAIQWLAKVDDAQQPVGGVVVGTASDNHIHGLIVQALDEVHASSRVERITQVATLDQSAVPVCGS